MGELHLKGVLPENTEARQNETQQTQPQPEQRRRFRRRGGSGIASVYFLDTQNAWAVGSAGSIYRTLDGGENWERQLGEQDA